MANFVLDEVESGAMVKASIAENGGFWPPAPAAHFGAEPSDDVAKLLTSEHWRLVEMNTGHWPMFSQPHELTQILLAAC